MSRSRIWPVAVLVVAIIIMGAAVFIQRSSPQVILLKNTYSESPTAFTFQYPDGWQYQIPQRNLLILAEPETFLLMANTNRETDAKVGPNVTIQRSETLYFEGGLEEALDAYLRRGPMRPNRSWEIIGEKEATTLNEHEAVTVNLQGSEFPDWPKLRMRVTAALASNKVVYLLIASSALEDWEQHEPLLQGIIDSMEIIE